MDRKPDVGNQGFFHLQRFRKASAVLGREGKAAGLHIGNAHSAAIQCRTVYADGSQARRVFRLCVHGALGAAVVTDQHIFVPG